MPVNYATPRGNRAEEHRDASSVKPNGGGGRADTSAAQRIGARVGLAGQLANQLPRAARDIKDVARASTAMASASSRQQDAPVLPCLFAKTTYNAGSDDPGWELNGRPANCT